MEFPGWARVANPQGRMTPSNEVPVSVAIEHMLVRTDQVAVALVGVRVYRSGVELVIQAHRRHPRDRGGIDVFGPFGAGNTDQFVFGVEFADGQAASTLRRWSAPRSHDEPMLMRGGGPGTDGVSTANFFLTPLPPAGRLTLISAWPVFDIAEARTDLDTTVIRAAASRAVVLWPHEPEPEPIPHPDRPPARLQSGGWFENTLG